MSFRCVLAAAMSLFACAQQAMAQGLTDLVPTATFQDERGVDLNGPTYRHREQLLRIGTGDHPLTLDLNISSPAPHVGPSCYGMGDIGGRIYHGLNSHAYFGGTGGPSLTIALPYQTARFAIYGSTPPRTLVPHSDEPYMTVAFTPGEAQLNYIGSDGTEATFSGHAAPTAAFPANVWKAADQVRFPDGEVWTYYYNDISFNAPTCGSGALSRVRSIVSNRGYAMQLNYASEATTILTTAAAVRDWGSPTRVTVYNKAAVYCNETLLLPCASVTALSSAVTFAYDRGAQAVTITKANGEQVVLTFAWIVAFDLVNVTRPGGVSRSMSYASYSDPDLGRSYYFLHNLSEAGRTWNYSIATGTCCYYITTSVQEPSGTGSSAEFYDGGSGTPESVTDGLGRQTQYFFVGPQLPAGVHYPEGNRVYMSYDTRGNLTTVQRLPKTGTGTLQATATFPSACTSTDRRTCNRPTSTTDFNGNTSDYTYDTAHGGVLTQTGPAVNGVRPQTRHAYEQRHAWISNGSGGYTQSATPVWVRIATSSCRTSAATGNPSAPCTTAGDEVLTQYDHGPNNGPNTLLLRGQTVTATDGGVTTTLRTCYGYDVNGNRISETSPNANLTSCP